MRNTGTKFNKRMLVDKGTFPYSNASLPSVDNSRFLQGSRLVQSNEASLNQEAIICKEPATEE